MITHNMKAALDYGIRTIMMHEGRVIEVYSEGDQQSATYKSEVWLPIAKKK